MDVTISLTGSAGLRPGWPRRAIAIARAVVAVAASGDGPACPSVPADRAVPGAAGACAAGRGRQLLAAGTTVVLTTHYLQEAGELADRLAIMHQGRIVRTGTPAEVAASQPARISFELPGSAREPVPGLAGTRVSITGRNVLLQTQDLQRTLTALLGWANSRGLVLAALDARPASLEEAFHAVAACGGGPASGTGNAQEVAA